MRFRLLDITLYLTMLSAVSAGLVYGRRQAFKVYGDQSAQSEWDAWREDAKELTKGPGPVIRRAPKSVAPPALVLMRDYFAICLTLALLLSSVLFIATLTFIRGAFTTARFVDRSPPEQHPTEPRTK